MHCTVSSIYSMEPEIEIEIPQYFICPISLQIMKDPVTTVLGITYDREGIEQWFASTGKSVCPVTKQSLLEDSSLTPNHTLRRLIQAWCVANKTNGVDRIPTPRSPLDKIHVLNLVKDMKLPDLCQTALEKMETMATDEDERNRKLMGEAGVAKAMVSFILKSFKEGTTTGLEQALTILHSIWSVPLMETDLIKLVARQNLELIDSLTWILQLDHPSLDNKVKIVNEALPVLKKATEATSSKFLGCLRHEFFKEMVTVLKNKAVLSQQAIKSALHVLIETCSLGSNRTKIVNVGAVFELVELELEKPERNMTELIFNLLANLCCCADGREQLLRHAGSIAVISKRILRVSAATDDQAIHILWLVATFSATNDVVLEMLKLGAVTKLCMVMQANCTASLKDKTRRILRLNSKAWNNSPCTTVY